MITITNGTRITVCTKGAFKNWYEPMGWKIAGTAVEQPVPDNLPEEEDFNPENSNLVAETSFNTDKLISEEDSEVEIPLSEMTASMLRSYAEDHGIDVSAAKRKQDIIDIIKAEMEE